MDSLALLIITGLCCLLAGGILGALVHSKRSNSEQKNRDLEAHLHQKQDEIKQYRQDVTEHFVKTSDLLNNLTETYRDIHNHLANSASTLTQQGSLNHPIIKSLPEATTTKEESTPLTAPPLDYAPKSTPYDKGTLAEDHGLEKVELAEKPIEDYAEAIAENAKQNA